MIIGFFIQIIPVNKHKPENVFNSNMNHEFNATSFSNSLLTRNQFINTFDDYMTLARAFPHKGLVDAKTLLYAIGNQPTEVVKELLDLGGDPNERNSYHFHTPLSHAALNHKHDTLQLLIDAGANINYQYEDQNTLLMSMITGRSPQLPSTIFARRDLESIKILIKGGSNLNHQNKKGETALMIAARRCIQPESLDIINLLLEAGANVDLKNSDSWSALGIAIKQSTRKPTRTPTPTPTPNTNYLTVIKTLRDASNLSQVGQGVMVAIRHSADLDTLKLLLTKKKHQTFPFRRRYAIDVGMSASKFTGNHQLLG